MPGKEVERVQDRSQADPISLFTSGVTSSGEGCLPSHRSHLGLLKLGLGNVTSISWAAWHAVYHPTVHRAARNKELYKPKSQQYLAEKP